MKCYFSRTPACGLPTFPDMTHASLSLTDNITLKTVTLVHPTACL
jgi:hypothetical protein